MSLEKSGIPSCARCGHTAGPRDRFCSQCGNKLAQDFHDSSPLATRRERKIVSVMFADVKGSTEVVSKDDPEHASEWLERIVDVMRRAVHQFGGTVNRVQGDGIMALFGAPVEYEDHCIRACAAALAMLDGINSEPAGSGPKPSIRIGIASGEVMTLPVVSDPAVNYDAMGAVVHLAARLEQAASPGTALISLETRQGALKAFETREREFSGLRGLPAMVPAFELVGWKSKRGIEIGRRALPQGSFVGRESAMDTLRNALSHLSPKSGRVVFVTGEPGVGKSRLIAEFVASVSADVRVCVSQSSPYRGFAYGPLADLVADLVGIDAETTPDARKMLLANVLAKAPQAAMHRAALDILLDVDSPSSGLASLSPIDRRLRVEAAAIALFRSVSEHEPLILVCEDIHWLDEDSLGQISRFWEGVRTGRCLAIVTARDMWRGAPALQEQSDYRCQLEPLAPAYSDQMLNALVRPGRGTTALIREVLERTRGNPLFIEETLNVLHQMGALVCEGPVYALKRPGVDVPLSPTVRGLLAARIDRLEDLHKDVLQAIAVIGESATFALLQSLLGLDRSALETAIDRLIALGLLANSASAQQSDDIGLTFRHPLVREVAYEQTLMRDRARIHKWMLTRLEDEQRGGLRDRPGILAEHAFRAEAWEKAAQYMLRAGNDAFWRDAKTEAVRYLMRGLEAVDKSDSSETRTVTALGLRLELRNPLFQLARIEELGDHLHAARPLALQLSDPTHTGRYHIFQSHYHWFTGDSESALREAEAARLLADSTKFKALALRAQFQRGLVDFSCGRHRDAIAVMNEVTAAIASNETHNAFGLNMSLLVTTLAYSARAHADLGELAEARKDAARSLAIARELNNQFEWVFAYLAEGWVNVCANDPERAVPFLERAYETCANEDVPLMGPVAASFLSAALLMAADHRGAKKAAACNRALRLADEAVRQGEEFRFGAFQPWRLAILSRALLAEGRRKEALERAMVALDSARRQMEPLAEIEALTALSQTQHSLGMEWMTALRDAATIADRLEMSPALAWCRRCEATLEGLS